MAEKSQPPAEWSSERARPTIDARSTPTWRNAQNLETIIEQVPMAVFILEGPQHTFSFANAACLAALPISDVVGLPLARALPALAEQVAPAIQRVLDTGQPMVVHETAVALPHRARHQTTYMNLVCQPQRDATGAVRGVLVCGFDVTDQVLARQRAECATEAWRLSDAQFRLAIQSSGLIVFGQDLELRHVWIHNPTPGFTPESIVGKTDRELHTPENAERLERLKRHVLTGESIREEVALVWPNAQRHYQLTAEPHRDGHGAIDGIIGACLDITEQVRARVHLERLTEQLRESELQFRTLADSIPQLAWIVQPNGDATWYNQRWYDYTGTTLESMRGWGWETVHDPAELPRVRELFRAALASGQPWEDTFPLRRADGAYEWFLSRAMPVHDSTGSIVRWFGTNTNVDEHRKQAALLKAAVELRDDFLSIAGHELKTPLAALLMHIQSIQRARQANAPPIKLDERLTKAAGAAARLDKLINQMLDVSRITSGRLQLECEAFSLDDLLRDIVDRFSEQGERVGSAISLRSAERVRGSWDRFRIDQVFTNLIGNALKYGDGKPIEVTLRLQNDGAEVSVRDRGIGIDPSQQEKIFQRFERAVGTREFGGFGLGLWICRQIVDASGGRVAVVSARGAGSTFVVWLPLQVPPKVPE